MSRTLAVVKEWINPNWSQRRALPPMEAGLRPNRRLDEAEVVLPPGDYEPEDVVMASSGEVLFSSGNGLFELRAGDVRTVAEFSSPVGSLTVAGTDVVAAVEGVGLVAVSTSGSTEELCTDPSVARCVTDLAALPDGSLLAAVGSRHVGADGWARALVDGDRSGRLVRVDGTGAGVEADELGWPAGVAVTVEGDVVVSLSLEHRIEKRAITSLAGPIRPLFTNLPVYPGRVSATDGGCWVAAPYARNRVTELLLDEPELLAEMVATISPEEWFVPRLRSENPYTDPLQMGQLRVLGIVKPWAPPRSYGLAFRLGGDGRVVESAHSRVDGKRHGVTGVSTAGERVVLAARGHRSLLGIGKG